jgi:hypothetical protein
MQATRYHNANPNLKINTEVMGTPDAPEVTFKFIDDTEVGPTIAWNLISAWTSNNFVTQLFFNFSASLQKRFDSQNFKANEILFDVHLFLDRLDNEFEMSGKSLDD